MNDQRFDNVVFIGPSIKGRGGMEELARLYLKYFENIVYLPSNSPHGTIVGFFVLLSSIVRLPFYRLKGRTILHIHFTSGKSFFRKVFVALIGRILFFKIIFHCHSGDFPEFVKLIGRPVVKSCLSIGECVIVLSPYWFDYFANTLGCRRVEIVPNIAYNKQCFEDKPVNSPIQFIFLGGLTPDKGVEVLLEAYKKVNELYPDKSRLIIAGVGPLSKLFDQQQNRNISLLGWVSPEHRDRLLAESDVVVLPSRFECQPMSLIEGMSAGCGLISTRVGGIPDMIEHEINGLLIDPDNVAMLIDAMCRYIESPDLIKIHAKNSKNRIAQYSPSNIKSHLIDIYSQL